MQSNPLIMRYFTIKELCHSDVANRNNIKNIPNGEQTANLVTLVEELLDPIRIRWGKPLKVNSGFRSKDLNAKVGGSKTSSHCNGEAADINAGSKLLNAKLFDLIRESGLDFDQLIDEKNYSWIHVSYRKNNNRKQILHLR